MFDGPDSIIQAACNPLTHEIACLLGLREYLVTVYIRDIGESFAFS
jgi:hypothetical protein